MFANKLKSILRKGWIGIEISKKRTESVAEYVFRILMLSLAIDSEYELCLEGYMDYESTRVVMELEQKKLMKIQKLLVTYG